MKNQYKQKRPEQQWQGWPLEHRHSDWLNEHTGFLLGCTIVAGSIFSFICGVIVGVIQPPFYHWVLRLLGVE
jgi:hypothetical protein